MPVIRFLISYVKTATTREENLAEPTIQEPYYTPIGAEYRLKALRDREEILYIRITGENGAQAWRRDAAGGWVETTV